MLCPLVMNIYAYDRANHSGSFWLGARAEKVGSGAQKAARPVERDEKRARCAHEKQGRSKTGAQAGRHADRQARTPTETARAGENVRARARVRRA